MDSDPENHLEIKRKWDSTMKSCRYRRSTDPGYPGLRIGLEYMPNSSARSIAGLEFADCVGAYLTGSSDSLHVRTSPPAILTISPTSKSEAIDRGIFPVDVAARRHIDPNRRFLRDGQRVRKRPPRCPWQNRGTYPGDLRKSSISIDLASRKIVARMSCSRVGTVFLPVDDSRFRVEPVDTTIRHCDFDEPMNAVTGLTFEQEWPGKRKIAVDP